MVEVEREEYGEGCGGRWLDRWRLDCVYLNRVLDVGIRVVLGLWRKRGG